MLFRRTSLLVSAIVALLLVFPVSAFADESCGYVFNLSQGHTGEYGNVYVQDRFPATEGQFVALVNRTDVPRSDDHLIVLSWELFQKDGNGPFYPVADIYYPDGTTGYPLDRFVWWYTGTVGSNQFHTLRISQHAINSSTIFDVTCDSLNTSFWWNEPTGNIGMTGMEVEQALSSTDYYSMGHIKDIELRNSSGNWVTQGSSWGPRISTFESTDSAPDYVLSFENDYYNWVCNRL